MSGQPREPNRGQDDAAIIDRLARAATDLLRLVEAYRLSSCSGLGWEENIRIRQEAAAALHAAQTRLGQAHTFGRGRRAQVGPTVEDCDSQIELSRARARAARTEWEREAEAKTAEYWRRRRERAAARRDGI